ncbi:unnamed protein product [Cylindrotheca closterium]|uniref:tRNA/rRNA methyltransferase SpoU type domain-containing protein n=1 Tax=Cylindrotheca closterium TaxID=2856 RepID=A0AAD2CI38_9STRA|nr:unnamed protein product [Cylindrotheca closterium]
MMWILCTKSVVGYLVPSFKSFRYLSSSIPTKNVVLFSQSIKIDGCEDKPDDNLLKYVSKSTAKTDAASQFHEGSKERRQRLHAALSEIGIPVDSLVESPEFKGSAAIRTYNSFILPKSEGALAMTMQPQRASVVANNISFLMREHRSHQEEWLRNHDRSLQEAAELQEQRQSSAPKMILLLDDVRSAHNVGNIIRAAEASGCEKVIMCGSMTPSPPHPKVLKTALGAAEYVPYQSSISTLQAIRDLKANGYQIFGIETTSRSKMLWQVSFFEQLAGEANPGKETQNGKVALVFGNELVGVDVKVLEECNELVSVPTHGIKNSLNVATCASIIVWEVLRQWDAIELKTKEA